MSTEQDASPAPPADADPPPESPFWEMEEALLSTLRRSFRDRMKGSPDAEKNLDNAFWGKSPKSTWEAVTFLGPMCTNIIVRLYDRIKAIDPSLRAWSHIRYLRNVWYGGSAGFKVVYEDAEIARDCLDGLLSGEAGKRVARDAFLGGLEHQLEPSIQVALRHGIFGDGILPDADTWREIDKERDESVHFCIGKHDPRPFALDDIHLDWCSPVVGVDPRTNRCQYAPFFGPLHYMQAMMGIGAPAFTFQRIDGIIDEVEAQKSHGEGESRARTEWDVFVKRWDELRWRLAVRGKRGYERSLEYLDECNELSGRLRAELPFL